MLAAHTCYRMSRFSTDGQAWEAVPSNAKAFLQCGERYGMLWIEFKCTCCEHTTYYDFFFSRCDGDAVLRRMAPRLRRSGNLQLFLPDGTVGLFRAMPHIDQGIDDAYVLRNVACVNYHNESNATLVSLFQQLRRRVQTHASFKRLRRYLVRTRSEAAHIVGLCVLHRHGVNEVGIRMRIMAYASLW